MRPKGAGGRTGQRARLSLATVAFGALFRGMSDARGEKV
ncbi:predicted protein [Plenodomus lingam JN3]|uniref:Predicted protein n=1 Tax=Leptosphaeria maculans (strain JN3 / isolate v23.1.3 / race Av1-4-5-6-7-8) TaxID=985895 RepID=E4ZXN0_LEPMJ|nr:predicted protein [Plenodomus lingam JN3]CBX96125.1 predicted protein [Plenodomus lingam JN3]